MKSLVRQRPPGVDVTESHEPGSLGSSAGTRLPQKVERGRSLAVELALSALVNSGVSFERAMWTTDSLDSMVGP
jgi:hypothetical protein